MINSVTIAGNTTRDFEIRRTNSGMAVASFGIAVNDRKKNQQTGAWDEVPYFFDVVCFGDRWEKVAQYVPKGTKLTVQGKLRQSSWTDSQTGAKRSKVEIIADEVELPPRLGGQQRQPVSQPMAAQQPATNLYDDDIPF